ncbi:MAG: McrB family protein [bacterium]
MNGKETKKDKSSRSNIQDDKNKIIKLLQNNYQVILNGAPGAGKTYTAREVALEITNDPKNIKLVQFHPSYDYTDFVEGYKPVNDNNENIRLKFKLTDGVFKEFCNTASKPENNKQKYVFIIDEINRAEISKVFGELMFALEPDYREKINEQKNDNSFGGVSLQYSKEIFKIPDNVYIIGTMNDIDRSVEVFDFAMRRRFAWHEIKANEVMESVLESMLKNSGFKNIKNLAQRANYINNCITNDGELFGLNEHFHIGPSYFSKIIKFNDDDKYRNLWDYYIKQIITEYVKGYTGRDSEEFIKKCEKLLVGKDSESNE